MTGRIARRWRIARHRRLWPTQYITIVLLPPRSPELNPVENVWQFMRDNWLSNRVFTSYDDIVDHCLDHHVHRHA
jgi:transposase